MEPFLINEKDNVCVDLQTGHKIALCDISQGADIIKYGYPIGIATEDIAKGDKVHSHNMKTKLGDILTYEYNPDFEFLTPKEPFTIRAFVRKNGDIGIRNDVFIVPTVGCVNSVAKILSEKTGAICFSHPYGCSQLGDDMKITQLILRGLINHPNAGGVLVLGLGCENNNISEMQKILGTWDVQRVKFLSAQDCEDEIAEGIKLIEELKKSAAEDKRQEVPVSKLKIGLKCGGSDGFSGITANAIVGKVTDELCAMGASAVLTEVPEMFGAETVLFRRCINEDVFNRSVALINNFKQYFKDHNQPVSENPSPGNKDGGITTLEEKSLGCIQKGGTAPVTDVLDYGDTIKTAGLNLLNGPGNDIVSVTNLAAVGCHLVLFTTGRGTPLGGAVPTIKIASNDHIATKKKHWIDYSAFGFEKDEKAEELLALIRRVADGEKTKNELYGNREIAIFKDGVTL
ncbi:MAG: altronate dehydratase [Ruminococcaceae bacterium]|nr:altronate dehydratase [Oscillospiraceae bacterium]